MSKKFLVSGNTTIETTVLIENFPIEYSPIRFPVNGIHTSVSGIGINQAFALKALGAEVRYLSMIGNGYLDRWVIETLKEKKIDHTYVLECFEEAPKSVILYDGEGNRQINVDPKDIEEKTIPKDHCISALEGYDVVILGNMNYNRPLLHNAKNLGKLIAVDVQVLEDVKNEYNKEFMSNADILFLSNEKIKGKEKEFILELYKTYQNDIMVIGMGKEGALIHVKNEEKATHYPAVTVRSIVSTVGAGDSLFSSFIYYYAKYQDPHESIKKVIVFAAYKIGEKGGAEGFLNEQELNDLYCGETCYKY